MSKKNPTWRDTLREIAYSHELYKVFSSFVQLSACALAAGTREDEYLSEIKHWEPKHHQLFSQALGELIMEMEEHPYEDLLGTFYLEEAQLPGSRKSGGEFYTPASICRLSARLIFDVSLYEKSSGPVTLLEPCCGSGNMVLAHAELLKEHNISPLRMRATCVDISKLACDMCFINLTMWGIPATIVHGNSLAMEVYAGWRNLFWWSAYGVGTAQVTLESIRELETYPAASVPEEEAKDALLAAKEYQQNKKGQYLFDFSDEGAA